jgi:hypothetical protein
MAASRDDTTPVGFVGSMLIDGVGIAERTTV